jgi:hypothetical protein
MYTKHCDKVSHRDIQLLDVARPSTQNSEVNQSYESWASSIEGPPITFSWVQRQEILEPITQVLGTTALIVTGGGVMTLVSATVLTVAVMVLTSVIAFVDVAVTVTCVVGAVPMAQEQSAERSAGG